MVSPERQPDRNYSRLARVIELRTGRSMDAILAEEAPRVPWDVFIDKVDWKQGEHVGLVGPTGQGKTTLLLELLPIRRYVLILASKPVDDSMVRLQQQGYHKIERWENLPPNKYPRRILWPNARKLGARPNQRKEFLRAFSETYIEGKWCIVADEGFYLADMLKLKEPMRDVWTQGRSLGLSFVVCTQRPAWVPVEMYDSSTHLFFWRTTEEAALKRLSSLGGSADPTIVRYIIQRLEMHQCLYVNTRTGEMCRTRAPKPNETTDRR
jgi:hypothetical protein